MSDALPPLLLDTLEALFNRYLALDPEVADQLGELDGRCLEFDLSTPRLTLYVLPRAGAIDLRARCERAPDCVVRGSALALYRMVRSPNPAELLSRGEVEILGESHVLQRFADILKQLEIDWEELASKVVGDFAAHRLGSAARGLRRWLADSLEALRLDTREYLQEEAELLPTRDEVQDFVAAVDRLREDLDRLAARVRRLERRLRPAEPPTAP